MAKERPLTTGEIAIAKKIYKTSLDYSSIKVHDEKYVVFQPNNSGMTPNGEIYVSDIYKTDYSASIPALKSFFIHEMAHVYQYQMKILNPITAAIGESFRTGFDYDEAYYYELDAKNDLLDYRIEQQAQIIEDYYRLTFLSLNPSSYMKNKLADVKSNLLFNKVLKKFLANPSYAQHVVKCTRTHTRKICKRVLVK